jgi:hypothetical protein
MDELKPAGLGQGHTMAELYELRRVIIKHSRSVPPGPVRNEHRQIASSMRSLSRDKAWLAVLTVTVHWGAARPLAALFGRVFV